MKKLLFPFALAIALTSYAQDSGVAQDAGRGQLSEISPTPGEFSLETHETGFASIIINFYSDTADVPGKKSAEVNRDANLWVTLTRNGEPISYVPASNTWQIKFDSTMEHNWCISFFTTPGYESFAGGHYQVIIPEGLFLIGSEATPNSEIVLNYYMDTPATSIFPAEGGYFYELQDWILTFGNAEKVEVNPEVESEIDVFDLFASEVPEGQEESTPADRIFQISCNGNAVTLHLPKAITAPGMWMFMFPEKYFLLTDSEGKVTFSGKGLAYQYRIPTVSLENQPVAEPAPGPILDFPGVIILTLAEGQQLTIPNDMGKNVICAVNEDGTDGEVIADYRAAKKQSKYYYEVDENGKVDNTRPIAENANKIFLVNRNGEDVSLNPAPGKYRLVTTKSLYTFKQDGNTISSPGFTYEYEVQPSDYFDMEFAPAQDVPLKELKDIYVKFPKADEINVKGNVAWFRSSTTNYQFYPRLSSEDPQTVIFSTPVAVTIPGAYRLTSDASSIEVDGEYVGVMVEYTIGENTGVEVVESVTVLPAVFDIYNAQGMIICKDASIEDLNALPAGIYIAGGKKFINR